jgi:hypothetical protein
VKRASPAMTMKLVLIGHVCMLILDFITKRTRLRQHEKVGRSMTT